MASSSSSFPSAFSSQPRKYHIFLSFRGEDTRKTFVDHLYSALDQQGIYTYKDDETLSRGESIGPSLKEAIEQSQIAVIVFSKNYANSSWCLDELVHIMECKVNRGQTVIPIFYDVDPSALRKQKREYGEAFSKYELENNTKVDSWRKALVDASNISGWEPKHVANGHESKCIKEIVDTISHQLHPVTSSGDENLVGIEARVEVLRSKLQIGSGGVGMIGIWGVGGGGKTTLAHSVYKEVSREFDGCCFFESVREKSSKKGLESLQEEILSHLLKQNHLKVESVEEGKHMIKDKLCHRKVLIVLDDVDHLDQLKALAGSHHWFGRGSRIIITTRDEHVLSARGGNAPKIDVIHDISLLNSEEAIKLFRMLAPRDYRPKEDYEQLSEDVVHYAGGLPLAITVLGSFLCDKDIDEWMNALARLKEIPHDDIVGKLKMSFDGLTPLEKELFLDIACFYRRRNKDWAMEMLNACGFYPVIGVRVLIQKALITTSKDGLFDMHDLVQEMGHYIVKEKYPRRPENHTRVWKQEDVLKLCAIDATRELDVVEAIRFYPNRYSLVQIFPPVAANIKNLRCIDWRGDIARPFPTNFPPVELCCLILTDISQKQLWEGYKHLPNLKIMELTYLKKLIITPDFDGLPNLERFILRECYRLKEIHPSIGRLERLVFLSIKDCSSLKMFPPISRLEKLKTVSFSWCLKLDMLSKQKTDGVRHLHLDDSTGKEVASRERTLRNFFVTCGDTEVKKPRDNLTDVECCSENTCLPHNNMSHHTGLRYFPRGLRKLELWSCNVRDKDIESAVWDLPNLEELILVGNKFSRLNFSLLQIPWLKRLDVSLCNNLVELSELPSSIAVLRADKCPLLESFGDISNCKWLWKVSLWKHNKLDPLIGDILLHSMLQGKAIDNHCISVTHEDQIPKRFVGRLFRGDIFRLHLPDDWYNDFCGFLICIVTQIKYSNINIIIKLEVDEDSRYEVRQESNEAMEHKYDESVTSIGYVSFNSLRHTALLNFSYNLVSVSLKEFGGDSFYVGGELVPRKNKGDEVQTTIDCSEFWDKEREHGTTFTIQHDSKSSIKILWQPYYWDSWPPNQLDTLVVNNKKLAVYGDVDLVDTVGKLKMRWDTSMMTTRYKGSR